MHDDCGPGLGHECDEVLRALQAYLDREADATVEEAVRRHLGACSPCLGRADFERELRALVASRCRDAAPVGLMQRVLAVIRTRP